MKNFTTFLLSTLMGIATFFFAQAQQVSGKVVDDNAMPIPGVNVFLENTTKGALTDFDGLFSIENVEKGTYTIKASYVGYKTQTQEIDVGSTDLVLEFTMEESAQSLDQIIITGVSNPRAKMESSVSITSLQPESIKKSAPRTTAEILRTVPGIRAESSGGEGNSNIAVRGVPVSSGGSKYVQLQEDGLPVLLFGDISFATADIFTRFDANIKKIEAIRGGSASTLSSNSPGAIINFISKTGKRKGGSVSANLGLDYNTFRTDFEYGSPIDEGLFFHIGGFYRTGEGERNVSYDANNGGQIKFNLTKQFEEGYVRIYTKYLNDRVASYLPMPIKVTGTNANPEWENVPNFDATKGALQSSYLSQNLGMDENGNKRRTAVREGMHPVSVSFGFEAAFDLSDFWKIKNNARFSINNGGFIAPFPAQTAIASTLLSDDFASANDWGSFTYANTDEEVAENALVNRIHMFDVSLNNLNNFMNDFKISKAFDKLNITLGYFKSIQNISTTWMWNSYLQEVSDDHARLINVLDNQGNLISENGLYAYGTPYWGNLHRHYDTQYSVSAPYLGASLEATDKINIDGSIRFDLGQVNGNFIGGTSSAIDMNNDGQISSPEQNAYAIDNSAPTIVDYDYDYISYSLGVNYKFREKEAVFGRYSRGGSAKADRILFSGLNYLDGDQINALDFINQAEIGYKRGFKNAELNVTAFFAKTTEEGGFEATSNRIIENDYKSLGLEVEGYCSINNFSVSGALTYTNAEIESGENNGNKPRRQPDLIYNIIPTYNFGDQQQNSVGISVIGQTKSYTQDSNELVMPGFALVNVFVNYGITTNLTANLSVNNLFDSLGITEAEEASIAENQVNYIRASALPGRTISLGLNYKF